MRIARWRRWPGPALPILLVALLAACAGTAGTTPSGVVTATVTTRPTATATTPPPTATVAPIASYPTAAQAWGPNGVLATIPYGALHVGGVTPDGQRLLGYEIAADQQSFLVGWLTSATRQFTTIDTTPTSVNYQPLAAPQCCLTDGRFIVGANVTATGTATWSYDSHTQTLRPLANMPPPWLAVANGNLYSSTYQNNQAGVAALNLATGATAFYGGLGQITEVIGFAWPYLAYQVNGTTTDTIHLHNLATGADVVPAAFSALSPIAFGGGALDGDTFFYAILSYPAGVQGAPPTGATLYEMDHAFQTGAAPIALTTMPVAPTLVLANQRLVVIAASPASCSGDCTLGLAWDRTRRDLVTLATTLPPLYSPEQQSDLAVVGALLLVRDPEAGTVTIFNTATFPAP